MRYLRIAAICIFLVCAGLDFTASWKTRKNHDSTMPEITSSIDTLELSVKDPESALMEGLTASDGKDGDLTDRIMIAGTSHFLEDHTCKVKYVVFDSDHNSAVLTRQVRYTDYEPPKFSVNGPLVYTVGDNIRFLDRISARDDLDGDITDKIRVKSSSISNYEAGVYPVVLEASNSYGDRVSVELNVVVEEKTGPGLTVSLTDYLIYLKAGSTFSPDDYVRTVKDSEGDVTDTCEIRTSGIVNTGIPGCYQLVYSASDGEREGRAYLTVVVGDGEAK